MYTAGRKRGQQMKNFILLILAGSMLTVTPALALPPKVSICHKPDTIKQQILSVSQTAVASHLAHGDYVVTAETCDGLDNNCNGVADEECDVCSQDQDGVFRCSGTGFDKCDHAKWIHFNCPPGTECRTLGSSILCDFPTQ
jgi:hypothetical protein